MQNPHELSGTTIKWKVSHQMRHRFDSWIMTHDWWGINGQNESLKILAPCLEESHQWHFQQHHRTSTWPVVPVLIRCPGKPWTPDRHCPSSTRPQWTGTIKINFSPHTPNNYPHTPEWLGGSNPWLMTPRAQCHPVVNSPYHQESIQDKPMSR